MQRGAMARFGDTTPAAKEIALKDGRNVLARDRHDALPATRQPNGYAFERILIQSAGGLRISHLTHARGERASNYAKLRFECSILQVGMVGKNPTHELPLK